MIHAELDHRHLGSRPQLEQRERQADVVVQVALVPKHAGNARRETPPSTSFVVVFPALPVIATTFAPDRRRTSRATSCSAAGRVVDTIMSASCFAGTDAPSPQHHGRSTTAPRAPRASASATKRCPSKRSPRIATNRSPARERPRVDRDPVDTRRPGSPRPAARRGGRDISGGQRHPVHAATTPSTRPAARQRRARHLDVVERQHRARRSPGTSRGPCRRSARDRPARASRIARSMAALRSAIARYGVDLGAARPRRRRGRPASRCRA